MEESVYGTRSFYLNANANGVSKLRKKLKWHKFNIRAYNNQCMFSVLILVVVAPGDQAQKPLVRTDMHCVHDE